MGKDSRRIIGQVKGWFSTDAWSADRPPKTFRMHQRAVRKAKKKGPPFRGFSGGMNSVFPERQLYIRSNGKVRFLTIPAWTQIVSVFALVGVVGWVVFASGQYLLHSDIIIAKNERIRSLKLANLDLNDQLRKTKEDFVATTTELAAKHRQLVNLVAQKNDLEQQLVQLSKSLASIKKQRLRAVDESAQLRKRLERQRAALSLDISNLRSSLELEETETARLSQGLKKTNEYAANLTAQRDKLSRSNETLSMQISSLSNNIFKLRQDQQRFAEQVKERTQEEIDHLGMVITRTGLNLERLVELVEKDARATGGPLLPIESELANHSGLIDDQAKQFQRAVLLLEDRLNRWKSLQRVLKVLPITAPVNSYYVSSSYGRRRDPFTKTWAFHGGVDLGGTKGQTIFAPAPGKIVAISTTGPYGKMVDISHGYGIRTRYGHLKRILVKKGETVDFRQKIGKVGSSGRSTGSHLHYEVWFGNNVLNPAPFLKAGKYVFKE